jgi:hypothetical protein
MRPRRIIPLMLALCMLPWFTGESYAADTPVPQEVAIGQTPPRLSFTKGEVSFWRPGSQEWSQAQVNTPLAPDDLLYSGPQGTLEVQIGSRAFVRTMPNTQLGFVGEEPDFLQFKVTEGSAFFDLRAVEPGRTVEVDTPNSVFTIEHVGYYRVDVSGPRTSFTTRRSGEATATSVTGEAVAIQPSEEVVIEGTESPQIASYAAPQRDAWDKWNYARTDYLLDAVSARYVSPEIYGVDDLDRFGTWRVVPTYGTVWVPRKVPSGWVPYSTGSWVMDPYYGWTWVDTAAWGWAPFHYGRWVFVNGFWAWAPGPVFKRPGYAPALVAFFGGPSAGVSVGIGAVVGWVALGWGEPCVPWWGPESFRHRPWWGGWNGPRVVNNVVISKTTVVDVHEIKAYRNAGVRNAVVAVNENRFGHGSIMSARIKRVDVTKIQPIHTGPRVTPTSVSYVPRETRGISPPEKILKRSVVSTRPHHYPTESAPGGERTVGPGRVPTPAPRIVTVPQKRESALEMNRPAYGKKGMERSSKDRTQPPTPPSAKTSEQPKQAHKVALPVPSQVPPQQRGSQVARPPAEKGQPSAGPPEAGPAHPAKPPKMESPKRPEQASSKAAPAVSPPASPQQRGSQMAHPSEEKPQPSSRQAETGAARPATPSKMESPKPAERASSEGAPAVAPQAAPPHERGPQAASPAPAAPAPSEREKAARPATRVLPGEPANRLSPNRAETKSQERGEPDRPARSQKGQDKVPQEGQGN